MNIPTNKAIKWLALLAVICLAFVCYAMGNASGAIALVILGFVLEGAFWLFGSRLFNRKKSSQEESSPS
ncbi:hypothetical protein AMS58_16700 [Pseudoalteromonas porphyrae]|uniref:Phosphatidate cytidylyltransferase n=2 Tax=Pseudoalteromonas TaxID=53246 RepID=A0A0N0LXM0_9GAMM|nr:MULTISPECIES: hypothetical protein [Pseudoalteromonas]KPH60738.1 hypothetical protein ADS77_15610 [Pseudoalteromonas porphyrae]KPH93530.1 hypothetical protein AMS58_16700 [Pseudoalteromonas porphyrae]NMR24879.1 hypothetical protein [Pseudoalteromonas sp. NEC-BIFX-2020_015]NNG43477.1 hypothetical protein [Pseudoalteromonas sp. NEC-BIFX-2020_002]